MITKTRQVISGYLTAVDAVRTIRERAALRPTRPKWETARRGEGNRAPMWCGAEGMTPRERWLWARSKERAYRAVDSRRLVGPEVDALVRRLRQRRLVSVVAGESATGIRDIVVVPGRVTGRIIGTGYYKPSRWRYYPSDRRLVVGIMTLRDFLFPHPTTTTTTNSQYHAA